MAFTVRNLSVLAYAQGFTLWHYRSANDPVAAVSRPGFFDAASDMLAVGDMLLVSAPKVGKVLFVTDTKGSLETMSLAA